MTDEFSRTPGRMRLVVLISGSGRNLQALIDACAAGRIDADIVGVISSREQALGVRRAQAAGIPVVVVESRSHADRAAYDAELVAHIEAWTADAVILAGFMRILTPAFVRRYAGRLLNIHPSLLPRHPGLDTHRRVLEAGEQVHGATVHFVTEALDAGPRIIQGQFTVNPEDDADTLAERVMQQIETRIYPQAVAWLARGALRLCGDAVMLHGRVLDAPATLDDLECAFQ